MSKAAEILGKHPWVNNILDHFQTSYIRDGVIISIVNKDFEVIDGVPLVADFGDILPFLNFFGLRTFSETQIQQSKQFLWKGLFVRDGKLNLFYNHDWVLGLLDLYRQEKNPEYLAMAEVAGTTIITYFFRNGYLLDEPFSFRSLRSFLGRALPFNGGFIELWTELYQVTNNEKYLEAANRLAKTWLNTRFFKQYGLFERMQSANFPFLSNFINDKTGVRVQLFKDNTNFVWGLVSLYNITGEAYLHDGLTKWFDGFEQMLLNDGNVHLNINGKLKPWDVSLKAAFSSIDLFCDLIETKILPKDRLLNAALKIANAWLQRAWDDGLFPESANSDKDHLDANVDMSVALSRLSLLTNDMRYWQAAQLCKASIIQKHQVDAGFCMAIDRSGNVVDDRIIIKYQGLLSKLAFLPEDPAEFDKEDLHLLRDR